MADLARMRRAWASVMPMLAYTGWTEEDIEALTVQAKADMASGNASLISAWDAWLRTMQATLILRSCATCAFQRHPGLGNTYCAGPRTDLLPAYTPGHPLRTCPPDNGRSCPCWIHQT